MRNKISVIVFLYDKKLEEDLGIDLGMGGEIEAQAIVLISEIESIRECANEEILQDRSTLEMKSGTAFLIKGSFKSNLKLLEANGW